MLGMLIGVDNPAVGFAVHLINSAVIGALFGLLAWPLTGKIGPLLGAGIGYGLAVVAARRTADHATVVERHRRPNDA
jgi:hypothetical protein